MSAAERKSKKIYYTMGEVSEMFDVNPSLIRFWEQKFDILKPDKNKKGNRLFTPADVENLKLIYHLVKENGMTLAGAQKRLKQNPEGLERDLEIVERLQRLRAMLLEVRQELKGVGEDMVEVFVDAGMNAEESEIPIIRQSGQTIAQEPEADVAPLVPFQLQELWPENEYPKSDNCLERPDTADFGGFVDGSESEQDNSLTGVGTAAATEDAVLDFGFGDIPAKQPEPARPQVVEQTLF